MLNAYRPLEDCLARIESCPLEHIPEDAVWIDCLRPTREEDLAVERWLGVSLPTREEMQEIEPSSRLSEEDGALYLTASLLCRSESSDPRTTAVTFVLTSSHLATVRYDEPGTMPVAIGRITKAGVGVTRAQAALIILLDAAIDRLADITERTHERIEIIARHIFEGRVESRAARRDDHNVTLRNIGREGMRLGHISESLISLSRLLLFITQKAETFRFAKEDRERMKTMQRDVTALSDHVHGLEDRITFLLDATLGLISIQQNNIIKIFSVLAVIFMPPTMIASIYGMNFEVMPELNWAFGYPLALLLMILSAVATFAFFRWRRWL